jgi:hypothetical protein
VTADSKSLILCSFSSTLGFSGSLGFSGATASFFFVNGILAIMSLHSSRVLPSV